MRIPSQDEDGGDMGKGVIVILNGVSSSGKSSVARALDRKSVV